MLLKIIDVIEGFRKAKGLTRAQVAEKMGDPWDKEKLDKVLSGEFCPRAETIAEIMEALEMPTYPANWFRSKKRGGEDD